jgi:4,5-dihydroxyphthalate decarboxylase
MHPITIACWSYDRIKPLESGQVRIEGCDATFLDLEPEELFHRALHFEEFDHGYRFFFLTCATTFVAIRVGRTALGFTFTRDRSQGSGFVGSPEYQVTASVWIRGILEDEYQVKPSDIRWRAGGLYEPSRTEKVTFSAPAGVELERIGPGKTLSEMLLAGEIDAIIGPRAPEGFHQGHPDILRLFPDYIERGKDYYRRTGIFPIMHLLAAHKKKIRELPGAGEPF